MKNPAVILRQAMAGLALLLGIVAAAPAVEISTPVILVATDRLAGSGYRETVLLAVPAGDGQHMGLIVNRPTPIELSALFPDSGVTQKSVDPIYFGGPEMPGALFAAVRASAAPSAHSVLLMPGLFLVTDQETVDRLTRTAPDMARYFTGFVVWGPAELSSEIASGMWEIQPAEADVLFRANPQQLWLDLARIRKQVAFR